VSAMPKALLMAGRLLEAERYTQGARVATQVAAADELRRLHAEVVRLQSYIAMEIMAQVVDENARIARAAIAKAEEVKP
jgi:hypothetical protein